MKNCDFYHEAMCLFILLVLVTTGLNRLFAQSDQTHFSYHIKLDANKIYKDDLGFIYLITSNNEVFKYDTNFKLKFRYKNDRFGLVYGLDTSNPFKILVFYGDYQMVIMLDNALTETERYDLNQLGFSDVFAVGLSNDNLIWVYDPIVFKLKKISNRGTILVESANLVSEQLESITPEWLFEANNEVFLFDRDSGLHIFDNFAQYNHSIADFRDVEILKYIKHQKFLLLKNQRINLYSLPFHTFYAVDLLMDEFLGIRDFMVLDNKLYFIDNTGVFTMNVNLR